jgi:hypothetical protein
LPDEPGALPPAPAQRGTSQLPKGSVFETRQPSPSPPQQTLPKGSIFETDPIPIKTPPGKPDIKTPSLIGEVKSPPGRDLASIKWQNLRMVGGVALGAAGAGLIAAMYAWLGERFTTFSLKVSFDLVGKRAQAELTKLGPEIEAMMKKNPFRRLYVQVHGQIVVVEHASQQTSLTPIPTLPTAEFDKVVVSHQKVNWVGKQENKSKYMQAYRSTPYIFSYPDPIELPGVVLGFLDDLDFLIGHVKVVQNRDLDSRARAHLMSALTALLTTRETVHTNSFLALRALEQGHDSITALLALFRARSDPSASVDVNIVKDAVQLWDMAVATLRGLLEPE